MEIKPLDWLVDDEGRRLLVTGVGDANIYYLVFESDPNGGWHEKYSSWDTEADLKRDGWRRV